MLNSNYSNTRKGLLVGIVFSLLLFMSRTPFNIIIFIPPTIAITTFLGFLIDKKLKWVTLLVILVVIGLVWSYVFIEGGKRW